MGRTDSSNLELLNSAQDTFGGGNLDCFISKFSSNGTLLFSTFLGGSEGDWATNVAVDSQDNIIITGTTSSADFPVLFGYDETNNEYDAFISKFNSFGELLWSSYLGGSEDDRGYSVAIDSQDNILVAGYTSSDDFVYVTNGTWSGTFRSDGWPDSTGTTNDYWLNEDGKLATPMSYLFSAITDNAPYP